jgi:hypothetical protein
VFLNTRPQVGSNPEPSDLKTDSQTTELTWSVNNIYENKFQSCLLNF